MNNTAETLDSPVEIAAAAVKAAAADLRAAQGLHQTDVEALTRGTERLRLAAEALDAINAGNADAIARHAKKLEASTRDGSSAAPPMLVPSDQHLAKEITAQRTHAAAVVMVANVEASVSGSAANVRAAQHALNAALASWRIARKAGALAVAREQAAQAMSTFAGALAIDDRLGDQIHDSPLDGGGRLRFQLRRLWDSWTAGTGIDVPRGSVPTELTAAHQQLDRDEAALLTPSQESPPCPH